MRATRWVWICVLTVACAPKRAGDSHPAPPPPGPAPANVKMVRNPECRPLDCPSGTTLKTNSVPNLEAIGWSCEGSSPEPAPTLHCQSGEVVLFGYTQNGKRTGRWVHVDKRKGTRTEETLDSRGWRHGPLIVWDLSGNLLAKSEYVDGKVSHSDGFYPSGKRRSAARYRDGRLHGQWTLWYENGAIQEQRSYDDGKPVGRHQVFGKNGRLEQNFTYVDGKKTGVARFYDGPRLTGVQNWKAGQMNGHWENYDAKGNKISEGEFRAGKRDGRWLYYDNGQPTRSEVYEGGRMVEKCAGPGTSKCETIIQYRSLPGCRLLLPSGKHRVAKSERELNGLIQCNPGHQPEIDWRRERVFVANYSRQSNSGHRWRLLRRKDHILLEHSVGYACQGARLRVQPMPVIRAVDTGGLALRYEIHVKPAGRCGAVP